MSPSVDIRLLGPDDALVFRRVADGVFDDVPDADLTMEFLEDRRHHILVAIENDVVVGFASAIDFIHPDKAAQLWINEISVAASHRRNGIGRALLEGMIKYGTAIGCSEAWLATELENEPAIALYRSLGGTREPENPVLFSFALRR